MLFSLLSNNKLVFKSYLYFILRNQFYC